MMCFSFCGCCVFLLSPLSLHFCWLNCWHLKSELDLLRDFLSNKSSSQGAGCSCGWWGWLVGAAHGRNPQQDIMTWNMRDKIKIFPHGFGFGSRLQCFAQVYFLSQISRIGFDTAVNPPAFILVFPFKRETVKEGSYQTAVVLRDTLTGCSSLTFEKTSLNGKPPTRWWQADMCVWMSCEEKHAAGCFQILVSVRSEPCCGVESSQWDSTFD